MLQVDEEATPFVTEVVYASGRGWRTAARQGAGWSVPCRVSGCRVAYRFALGEAAQTARAQLEAEAEAALWASR